MDESLVMDLDDEMKNSSMNLNQREFIYLLEFQMIGDPGFWKTYTKVCHSSLFDFLRRPMKLF